MAEKSPAQKLLIKPGQQVLVVHPPKELDGLLGPFPDGARVLENVSTPADAALLFAASRQVLEADLAGLKGQVKPGGNYWVAYYKGTASVKTDVNRDSIYAYALSVGLQTVAMISIDENWSAMRMKLVG